MMERFPLRTIVVLLTQFPALLITQSPIPGGRVSRPAELVAGFDLSKSRSGSSIPRCGGGTDSTQLGKAAVVMMGGVIGEMNKVRKMAGERIEEEGSGLVFNGASRLSWAAGSELPSPGMRCEKGNDIRITPMTNPDLNEHLDGSARDNNSNRNRVYCFNILYSLGVTRLIIT